MLPFSHIIQGLPNTFFFLENALKKNYRRFSKISFKSTILPENNFFQIAASAGL